MKNHVLDYHEALHSLIIVRNRPQTDLRSRICSLTLFSVTRGGANVKFAVTHERFDASDDQCAIFAGLRDRISRDAQLIVREPLDAHSMLAKIAGKCVSMPLLDNHRVARALPGVTLRPLYVDDTDIQVSGDQLGLDMAGLSSTLLWRQRRAPQHAMALWAIYVRAFCSVDEANALIAAFQAWHILERVKPVTCKQGGSPRINGR